VDSNLWLYLWFWIEFYDVMINGKICSRICSCVLHLWKISCYFLCLIWKRVEKIGIRISAAAAND